MKIRTAANCNGKRNIENKEGQNSIQLKKVNNVILIKFYNKEIMKKKKYNEKLSTFCTFHRRFYKLFKFLILMYSLRELCPF